MHVVIVGGGLVGAAAAVTAQQAGYRVTLLERGASPLSTPEQAPWDLRISSVHEKNRHWLQRLGVWSRVESSKHLAYDALSVTTRDGLSVTFTAAEVDQPQLGVMVENNALIRAMWHYVAEHSQVELRSDTAVQSYDLSGQQLHFATGEALSYDLLIGADGANSAVARAAGIGMRGWDYDMRCLLAIVETEKPVAPATWEIFREQGPYALLPLDQHRACLIDYRSEQEWRSADEAAIAEGLEQTFAPHIGSFELQRHGSFPLRRQRALRYIDTRGVVLIGDAAHSIHPLAGQGVNLGFADVQELFEQLAQKPLDQALRGYERKQMAVNQQMMRVMDAIHVGFRSEHLAARAAVALGLTAVSKLAPLRKQIIRAAMGDSQI
ncbi:FAD-dependent oxidoreductase [Pseudidiomarina halophila]|uniref:UbiH/Coq6 family FAD-binding oxidoreductase n=1 Tax=Pseudidiomarina halophila TaxID=1449799 RepID=A0A432XZI7_9GAMM|nr:FAD-dependent oxidoreductase [Pseudidiomarina halophila]RUO54152.1 UbiH/Coq6 family FAD-binding oxidoreductase [Pseudidiomarina halophila]